MKVEFVDSESLIVVSALPRQLILEVLVPAGRKIFCMKNDMGAMPVDLGEERDDGQAIAYLRLFWVDPSREKTMDGIWSKYDNALKFKVTSGKDQGHVAYMRYI